MSEPTPLVQAMRVMHTCYCCDDADAAIAFLAEGVGLEARAVSKGIRADGTPLAIERLVETDVALVYDPRGGRVSPAIEVHGWTDPPAVGEPSIDATRLGIQALGVTVPALDEALERLVAAGARIVTRRDDDPLARPAAGSGATAVVRAPDGVTFDVVEDPETSAVQLAHLRITCSDLTTSVAWYSTLGWTLLDGPRTASIAGEAFGVDAAAISFARLRLPDEPFALLLVQWIEPPSHGVPYESANHRGLYRFALGVEDTRAATARLVDAGWTPSAPPALIELPGTKVPDMWITFFRDPDGIVVQLVERARDAFA